MGILVSQIYRLLWSRATLIVRDFGVTVPQMECLAVLHAQPGVSNVEIAAELRITPQAVSLVQRSLEEAGLVCRARRVADARVLTTQLTAKGRKLFEHADATLREDDDEILGDMTAKDRTQLRKLLGGVIEAMSAK
ncbi:MarR family transcriptional regulator [Mycobacterium sp. CBMA271]|uniref:MarR family winged helix-turn-helix transcriptional regulator n=1 Tax=unclassified Mycobacteroides TaxID=2618759 RepID=UPI0012DD7668|nr:MULTISPECIES: MarR family transcriptional regulator [unclassified Mycobacteroides]MUM17606.1 MarR family transcriptional regulator [Mycobacteroides sp. CBMA 326]MUM23120.1 MarR family transcriptional regulator [Mycobacteroides sp. CBMA 271]